MMRINVYGDKGRASSAELSMQANKVYQWVMDGQDTIRTYCASELLGLKNDLWLMAGEDEVTADEFKHRLQLEAITCRLDGSAEVCFLDGDLFWGHAIIVTTDPELRLKDAEIAG
jgi:hypothetical protein